MRKGGDNVTHCGYNVTHCGCLRLAHGRPQTFSRGGQNFTASPIPEQTNERDTI